MNARSSRTSYIAVWVLLAAMQAAASDTSQAGQPSSVPDPQDAAALNLEHLTQIEVTSVGRKDQKLSRVPAAVFVVTADDIRRSGASNIPDLLRMVPGIQVAQISSNVWAISARGFNGRGASEMLVMVDGRSIYNSLFSGTFWDQNLVPLDEIERIEVIRGPGATMWGANAVNGVISIVTKKAKDTRGGLVTAEGGQTSVPDAGIRYGGSAGDRLQYRLDGAFEEHPAFPSPYGGAAWDRWNSGRGDFRVDWQARDNDQLAFTGGGYDGGGHGTFDPAFPLPSPVNAVAPFSFSGGYVTGRWQHQFQGSDIALEAYYDRENRWEEEGHGDLNTIDLDFQHHIRLGTRNDLIWGLGYRWRADHSVGLSVHDNFDETLISSFVQDEITLVPDRLTLTAGARVQDYRTTVGGNFDFQPQARLLWAPSKHRSLWGAVSRAVHSPSQLDRDMSFPFELPPQNGINVTGIVAGDPQSRPETVLAYEAGYREQIGRKVTLDLSVFFDQRNGAFAYAGSPPTLIFTPAPTIVVNHQVVNGISGSVRGAELAMTWTPHRHWRLQTAYSREDADLKAVAGYSLSTPAMTFWRTPRNTLDVRCGWDITRRWSADATFSWVSRIPLYPVPHYTRVDVRIARHIGEGGEISAGVRNLFDREHLEFISEDYTVSSLVPRDVYARVMWRF